MDASSQSIKIPDSDTSLTEPNESAARVPHEPLGIKTIGVVRCDQPRVIDLAARHARKVDTLPEPIMDEVLAKVATLFE